MSTMNKEYYIEKDGVFGRVFDIYNKNYYMENEKLFEHNKLFIPENSVSCLVGCNGIGKSTLILQMIHDHENSLNKTAWDLHDSHSMSFRGVFDGVKRDDFDEFYLAGDKNTSFGYSDNDFMMNDLIKSRQSTGESNMSIMGPIFNILGKETNLLKGKRLFIFLDDLDVGVSIDSLVEIVQAIKTMEKVMAERGIKFYIILTANSFELARYFHCIDTVSFKPVKFKTYDSYVKYVCKSRKYKDDRDKKRK